MATETSTTIYKTMAACKTAVAVTSPASASCQALGTTTAVIYNGGASTIKRIDDITVAGGLANPTMMNVTATGPLYLYGALPSSLTSIFATNSTNTVIFDPTNSAPLSLTTFLGGSGNVFINLPSGWQNIPNLTVDAGSGATADIIGIPDLTKLTPLSAAKISNFEYIEIGGHAALSNWDVKLSGFSATNPNYAGISISKTLGGAVSFTNVPTTFNTIMLGVAPGAALTLPTVTTLNVMLDDSNMSTKSPITVANTITAAAATTVNLTSNGSNNSNLATANSLGASKLVTAAATTLNVYGSKQVGVDLTTAAALTKVDASGMTGGGLQLSTIAGGTMTSVIGSAYNDMFKVSSGTMAATLLMNGGAGIDTLNILTSAEMTSTLLAKTSNFEILDVGGSNTQTYANTQFTALLQYNPNVDTVAINSALAGGALTVTAPKEVNNLSIAVTPSQNIVFGYNSPTNRDSVNVVLDDTNAAALGAITVASLDVNAISNVNVACQGSTGHTITAIVLTNTQNVVVTGTQPITFTAFGGLGLSTNLDASGMTGAGSLTITSTGVLTSTAYREFIGSPNADSISLGATVAAKVVVQGGGGADTITKTAASTTGSVVYKYTEATDGGSNFGEVAKTATSLLASAGDQITANGFTTTIDKILIAGDLKDSIQNSQSGVIMGSLAPGSANTINFSTDMNGILFIATNAAALSTLVKAQTLSTIYGSTTLVSAITTITNEVVGAMRILALEDSGGKTAVYGFQSITADNAITADEIVLLSYVTGTSAAADFMFD